jgi:Asp-tRNA(Asn)/Glu-tRNA(Gln) amidotransferase C subunit
MSKEKDEQLAKALARILYLENRVAILEEENVGTTNALYEMENRLQSQLDAIAPRILTFKPNSAV